MIVEGMEHQGLLIPKSRLSPDPLERHSQLRNYFCDKDAVISPSGEYFSLKLEWSNYAERYVDPRLDEGLDWWGVGAYSEMASVRVRRGGVVFTLNDTWTLESWSRWLQQQSQEALDEVIVLHVDDHKDISSPRLFQKEDGWYDPISGEEFTLSDPESVANAINSGAIGMGSFLTPFLHTVQNVDLRHLCTPPKCNSTVDYEIKRTYINDTLLEPMSYRPAIHLSELKSSKPVDRYRFTNDLGRWLEGLEGTDKAILLHIDMDYFCNRYDGDSDMIENPSPNNPSIDLVLKRIDDLVSALNKRELTNKIVDIVIAFSPGFFPAEFWEPACNRLLERVGEKRWMPRHVES